MGVLMVGGDLDGVRFVTGFSGPIARLRAGIMTEVYRRCGGDEQEQVYRCIGRLYCEPFEEAPGIGDS